MVNEIGLRLSDKFTNQAIGVGYAMAKANILKRQKREAAHQASSESCKPPDTGNRFCEARELITIE